MMKTTVKNKDEKAALMQQALRWAEMFNGLGDLMVSLAGMCREESEAAGGDNVYLRRGCDEWGLRSLIRESLEVSARGGVRRLMRYKYQWHALYWQLEQRGWIGQGCRGLTQFCRQMGEWFPDVRVGFDYKGVAKGGEHRHDAPYVAAERWFSERMEEL